MELASTSLVSRLRGNDYEVCGEVHKTEATPLELHHVPALEPQALTGFGRGGNGQSKIFDNLPNFGDLLCVRFRKLALADIEAVFQTNPQVAARTAEERGKNLLRRRNFGAVSMRRRRPSHLCSIKTRAIPPCEAIGVLNNE